MGDEWRLLSGTLLFFSVFIIFKKPETWESVIVFFFFFFLQRKWSSCIAGEGEGDISSATR
jgi:hypothetical protein